MFTLTLLSWWWLWWWLTRTFTVLLPLHQGKSWNPGLVRNYIPPPSRNLSSFIGEVKLATNPKTDLLKWKIYWQMLLFDPFIVQRKYTDNLLPQVELKSAPLHHSTSISIFSLWLLLNISKAIFLLSWLKRRFLRLPSTFHSPIVRVYSVTTKLKVEKNAIFSFHYCAIYFIPLSAFHSSFPHAFVFFAHHSFNESLFNAGKYRIVHSAYLQLYKKLAKCTQCMSEIVRKNIMLSW